MSKSYLQLEFIRILEYGYKLGIENNSISTRDLVQNLSEQMKRVIEKNKK